MTDRVVDIEVVKKMGEQMVNVKEEMVENMVTKQNSSLLLGKGSTEKKRFLSGIA